jgi:hypothetical protein
MSKKTVLPKKGKPVTLPGDPPTRIRETLVGDPSINFTIDLDPTIQPSPEGFYIRDFIVEVHLTDVPTPRMVKVATIHIKTLTSLQPYFYIPFGDPDYGAGQQFDMMLKLRGKNAVTGEPIQFSEDNTFRQTLIGGGIVGGPNEKSNGKAKVNGKKK